MSETPTGESKAEAKAAAAAAKKAAREAEKAAKKKEREDKAAAKKADAERAKFAAKQAREMQRNEKRNGIRRPGAETICGRTWAIFDQISAKRGEPASIGETLPLAQQAGFNDANTRTEYHRWRKFHGVSGRVPVPADAKQARVPKDLPVNEPAPPIEAAPKVPITEPVPTGPLVAADAGDITEPAPTQSA